MTKSTLQAFTTASIVGLIIATAFITAITLIGDLYVVEGKTVLKDSLKALFGHHWVGKGVLAVLVYGSVTLVSYPWVKQRDPSLTSGMLRIVSHLMIVSSLIMLAFFSYEYFSH